MTKAEVINAIADKTGIDKDNITQTVEAFFKVVQKSMEDGENIYVRGFGSFINKKKARKVARNISQNTAMIIEAHYVPSFKPSKSFVEKIKTSKKLLDRLAKEEAENEQEEQNQENSDKKAE